MRTIVTAKKIIVAQSIQDTLARLNTIPAFDYIILQDLEILDPTQHHDLVVWLDAIEGGQDIPPPEFINRQEIFRKRLEHSLYEAVSRGSLGAIGFDDPSDNVYDIIAIIQNPATWEPYRASRNFDNNNFALWYSFNDELTAENMDGELDYQNLNFEPMNVNEIVETAQTKGDQFIINTTNRLRSWLDGNLPNNFDNAPRIDQ